MVTWGNLFRRWPKIVHDHEEGEPCSAWCRVPGNKLDLLIRLAQANAWDQGARAVAHRCAPPLPIPANPYRRPEDYVEGGPVRP